MSMSVIHANSSISVIPGSETLCSVHSGQLSAIRIRASGHELLEAAVVEHDLGQVVHAVSSAGIT